MTGALRYTAAAERDLLDIHAFITERSSGAAIRLLRRIDATCRMLAEQPGLGARRDCIREGMRLWTVGVYLILYRIRADGVEVVRVVHGHRDLRRIFPPDETP
jgi:toxin ParE1/3/4